MAQTRQAGRRRRNPSARAVRSASADGRLYELDKIFGPFGSNAAHPSDLYAQPDFREAVRLLILQDMPLATVMQYVEGNSWSLSSAALAALRKRPDRAGSDRSGAHPVRPLLAVGHVLRAGPVVRGRTARFRPARRSSRAKEWWIDNRWMPNVFRDYLARCAARGDTMTFGGSLTAWRASSHDIIRRFLRSITHPAAATLIEEIDEAPVPSPDAPDAPEEKASALNAVGRFWKNQQGVEILVEPDGWRKPFALAELTLRQHPVRSLLVSGEPMVGKTSFLRLFAQRIAADGWSVFEASGADLQADQIYIGQLEGRIRQVVEELGKGRELIWYIPDIVQLALSGTHSGQSATMLDQIIPAIASGRLVVWAEATPKGTARLVRIKPSLRGLFETVTIEPLSQADTLSLAGDVIKRNGRAGQHSLRPGVRQSRARHGLPIPRNRRAAGLRSADAQVDRNSHGADKRRDRPAAGARNPVAIVGIATLDPRHQGAARSQIDPRVLHRARNRPGRGGRGDGRAYRHAQGGAERSRQTDWGLSVRRPDRHRQNRARQGGVGISVRVGGADDPSGYERIPDLRLDEQDPRAEFGVGHREPTR